MLTATELAVNVPEVDPAAIMIELVRETAELLEASEMAAPPVGAAAGSVTVQLERAPPVILLGAHCNAEIPPLAVTTEIVAVAEPVP